VQWYRDGGAEEVQCRCRGAECRGGAEVHVQVHRGVDVQRWCRGAEVQKCRGGEEEVKRR